MKNQLAQKLMARKGNSSDPISRCNKGDNHSEIQALDASGPPTQAMRSLGLPWESFRSCWCCRDYGWRDGSGALDALATDALMGIHQF
jgi:hypothetical protein